MLVKALEANEHVPKFEVVIERILQQERKSKDKSEAGSTTESAMTSRKAFRRRFVSNTTRVIFASILSCMLHCRWLLYARKYIIKGRV